MYTFLIYAISARYIKDFLSFSFDDSDKPIKWLTDISILCCWLFKKKSTVITPLGFFTTIRAISEPMRGGNTALNNQASIDKPPGRVGAGVCEIEFITPPPIAGFCNWKDFSNRHICLKTALRFLVSYSITIKCMCKLGGGTTGAWFFTVYFLGRKRCKSGFYVAPGVNESKAFKFRFVNKINFVNCYSFRSIYVTAADSFSQETSMVLVSGYCFGYMMGSYGSYKVYTEYFSLLGRLDLPH